MIRVRFQPTNPGQFFACCGLLELADRLWDGAEGWFEERTFRLRLAAQPRTSLPDLLTAIAAAPLRQSDADDETSSPIEIPAPFGLRLDWWQESAAGCKDLKTWAGRMSGARIARAMQAELGKAEYHHDGLLDHGAVVYDPAEPAKKVEPFYFDARRICRGGIPMPGGLAAVPAEAGRQAASLRVLPVAPSAGAGGRGSGGLRLSGPGFEPGFPVRKCVPYGSAETQGIRKRDPGLERKEPWTSN